MFLFTFFCDDSTFPKYTLQISGQGRAGHPALLPVRAAGDGPPGDGPGGRPGALRGGLRRGLRQPEAHPLRHRPVGDAAGRALQDPPGLGGRHRQEEPPGQTSCWLSHSFARSLIHSLVLSFTHSLVHLFTYSLIH